MGNRCCATGPSTTGSGKYKVDFDRSGVPTVWTLNIELNTNPELVPLPADGTWVRFYYPDTEETVENLFYYNAATGRKLKTVVDNSKSWLTAESYAHYFEVFKGYIDAKPAGWTFVPHKKKDKEWLKYAAPDDTVWTVWAPHRFSDIPTLPLNLELVQAVNVRCRVEGVRRSVGA